MTTLQRSFPNFAKQKWELKQEQTLLAGKSEHEADFKTVFFC